MDKRILVKCPYHTSKSSVIKSEKMSLKCEACYEDHHDKKQGYKCNICDFYVHEECINVNIPSHHKHPLELTNQNSWMVSRTCCLCETKFLPTILYYKCIYEYEKTCYFNVCVPCARKPFFIAQTKAHEHELHQLPIELSFTCHACGLNTTNNPCVCLQCCFIIHRACILLPDVIYINRHDHRISRVSSPGPGKWVCMICIKPVNGECGAYSCMLCPYVVHSKCATSDLVWDGRELKGVPEEYEKGKSKSFKVIDQNLIKHFSHEHNLKFSLTSSVRFDGDVLSRRMEDKHCYACTLPLYFGLSYKCTQCDFILHYACANLPRKKRHEISAQQLTLCAKGQHGKAWTSNYFVCKACRRYCTGFSYLGGDVAIDVRCASISGIVNHESHQHSLFVHIEAGTHVKCEGCGLRCWVHLRCSGEDNCVGFKLCFKCATLPTLVRHKYDDHPLSLCYGEQNVNSTYCCGICEEEIFSTSWFYRCNDCASTLHCECVFKNLIHSRPGYSLEMDDQEIFTSSKHSIFDLLPNNSLSRPICYKCKTRCMGDLVLNDKANTNIFICCSCGFPKERDRGCCVQ